MLARASTTRELLDKLLELRQRSGKIGFVPTMGALHEGHLSLVRIARKLAGSVVVSIFVNPTQFGPGEDLDRYPRDLSRDLEMLEQEGVDLLFVPEDPAEIYPRGFCTTVECRALTEDRLCGRFRPGHFAGVATVCTVLFRLVRPDLAVFGQKDAQQLALIRRVAADLRLDVEIVAGPIIREADGLAMSSRNRYLSDDERGVATVIYKGLSRARELAAGGETRSRVLLDTAADVMRSAGDVLRIEYLELVDPATMVPLEELHRQGLLAAAAYVGDTRLIDNVLVDPPAGQEGRRDGA
jgi:pantoate--beta-alanine ligase